MSIISNGITEDPHTEQQNYTFSDKVVGVSIVLFIASMFGLLSLQIWGVSPQAAAATIAALTAPSLFITFPRILEKEGAVTASLVAVAHIVVMFGNILVVTSPLIS